MSEFLTPAEWEALRLSVEIAALAMAFALPPALFAGYALARWNFPGRAMVNALAHMPIVLPPVVTGYVLLLLFGRQGTLGIFFEEYFGLTFAFRWTGAALAAGVMAFPLILRPIKLAFESTDQKLEEASRSLGASRALTFLLVTLPLALPGILSGLVLGFAKALGEFGATITFVSNIPGETRNLSLALYTQMQGIDGEAAVFRLAMIAVTLSATALILSEVLARIISKRIRGKT
ncbi:molybdate ABC transporter permease subunit [Flexibacterium corallicola]|uniref:molybdate ABC transporter permease subunit n=1 Tax=Flexibacterium corallicola TaxID=3037259 RepID=UPI00286F7D05|nr:molybdate ABC transporter permease subunit [Pseudovibrio sp. M1P-2-3]